MKGKVAFLMVLLLCCCAVGVALAEELPLEQVHTQTGFVYPGAFAWGDSLEKIGALLPDPDRAVPGAEGYVAQPDNGYVSVEPGMTFSLEGVDLDLTLEFDEEQMLYGCWLSTPLLDPSALSVEERQAQAELFRAVAAALGQTADPVAVKGSADVEDVTFESLMEGRRRLVFFAGDGTCAQISAGMVQGFGEAKYSLSIGLGLWDRWPGLEQYRNQAD